MTNLDSLSATPPEVDVCTVKETWVKPTAVSAKVLDVTESGVGARNLSDVVNCAS